MGGVAFHLCYITEEEKRVLHRLYSMRDLPAPAGLEFVTERESGDIEVDSSDAVAKAPKAWISEPSHAKSLLTYVDDPTAAILKRLDLHGSGVDKHDHFGPDRIPSYQGDGGDGSSDGGGGGSGVGSSGDGGDGPNDPYVPPVVNTGGGGGFTAPTPWNPTPAARQPIYQSQYQNYANPYTAFNVSTYGAQPVQSPLSAGGASRENISNAVNSWIANNPNADMNAMQAALRSSGMNPYDVQNAGGFSNYGPQMSMPSMQAQQPFNPFNPFGTQQAQPTQQTPFSTQQTTRPAQQTPFSYQPTQQQSMFGGQMQGGGYGQYGANNPFSPYSNSFLNLDPNINRGTQADKANAYRSAIQGGFGDQQIRNQAEGLFGRQSQQDWGNLQASAMGMTPSVGQGSEQGQIDFYQNARNQGFNDQTIRSAANQMFNNPSQSYWSGLQNKAGYGGGGYGNQFMPQMQSPYAQQPMQQQMQTPFSYQPTQSQSSYGYSQPSAMTPRPPVRPPIQNPFSYQQPSYGPPQLPAYVSQTIRGLDQYQSQPIQAYQPTTQPYQPPAVKSSGPSQAIVGRSSQMRGTPNVMRRAKGGITSLMDDDK
jgi:hypothetical protein